MQIFKIILLVLLLTGLHAKTTKWKELKSVHLYTASEFNFKSDVKCLEMKTCTSNVKREKCTYKTYTKISICPEPLQHLDSKLIKRYKKLFPKASKKDNIRKDILPNSITNGFSIDDKGTIWRLNEVKDVLDILGEIDTPAEAQFVLWLHGKDPAKSYRKVAKGYEVLIENKTLSPCDGKKDYEEIFIYQREISKQGKISKQKLIKHTKKEVQ